MYNSIYPNYVNNYFGVNNRIIKRKQDDEKNSQSSKKAENEPQQDKHTPKDGMYFPNGEKTAIDYTKRQISIDQVVKDFKNTANAIGVPDDLKSEVGKYLSLVESQAQKEQPNAQIIQSNLKSASKILDEYITETLKKPSRVVENWVDTLFLQEVDYKSGKNIQQESEIPQTQPQPSEEIIAADEQSPTQEQPTEENQTAKEEQGTSQSYYIPNDAQLRELLIAAKNSASDKNNEQALYLYQSAMDYAEQIGDIQACAIIHYEQGKLYNKFNRLEDALYNYDRAAKKSSDFNIKARAHISMGKIYDDYVYVQPALDHYCAAVSFAGESDNLKLQTKALTDLAQIHTDRYEKDDAVMFMSLAAVSANETGNEKLKGLTYLKSAKNCEKLNEKARALRLYGNSSVSFIKTEDNENLAKNYRDAALIMLSYGNKAKAKSLLSKAFIVAQKTSDADLKEDITKKLAVL